MGWAAAKGNFAAASKLRLENGGFSMAFPTRPLSERVLDKAELRQDKRTCQKFGPCGVGKKALYLNSFYIDRCYYIPFASITRVFKRVAMSKGGFNGKGIFATIPYLVVVYDNGQEKQCNFKYEEQVDELLDSIQKNHPRIKTLSEEGERKLAARKAAEAAKPKVKLTGEAEEAVEELEKAAAYLEKRPALYRALTYAAKAKRANQNSNSAYRYVAMAIILMGVLSAGYGIWSWIHKAGSSVYFILFGLAAIFMFAGANVLPTGRNNRKYIEKQWTEACEAMESHLASYGGTFPVPAYYAHAFTLSRMIRFIKNGKAQNAAEAMEVLKTDLKAMNAGVTVEQEEYDEIVAIKPMFLIEDYR